MLSLLIVVSRVYFVLIYCDPLEALASCIVSLGFLCILRLNIFIRIGGFTRLVRELRLFLVAYGITFVTRESGAVSVSDALF